MTCVLIYPHHTSHEGAVDLLTKQFDENEKHDLEKTDHFRGTMLIPRTPGEYLTSWQGRGKYRWFGICFVLHGRKCCLFLWLGLNLSIVWTSQMRRKHCLGLCLSFVWTWQIRRNQELEHLWDTEAQYTTRIYGGLSSNHGSKDYWSMRPGIIQRSMWGQQSLRCVANFRLFAWSNRGLVDGLVGMWITWLIWNEGLNSFSLISWCTNITPIMTPHFVWFSDAPTCPTGCVTFPLHHLYMYASWGTNMSKWFVQITIQDCKDNSSPVGFFHNIFVNTHWFESVLLKHPTKDAAWQERRFQDCCENIFLSERMFIPINVCTFIFHISRSNMIAHVYSGYRLAYCQEFTVL